MKFQVIENSSKKILLDKCTLRKAQEIIDDKGWRMVSLRNGKQSVIYVVANDS